MYVWFQLEWINKTHTLAYVAQQQYLEAVGFEFGGAGMSTPAGV